MTTNTPAADTPGLKPPVEWDEGVRSLGSPERERFVLAHAPLVRSIAQKIMHRLPGSVEVADLINDGVVGLIEAIERFDASRGVRFGSFAEARIRGAILDSLRARDIASRSLRRKLKEMELASQKAEQRLGRTPEDAEVAEELGVQSQYVSNLRRDRESTRASTADPRLSETVPEAGLYANSPNPFELVSDAEIHERLAEEIEALPERERRILGLYYEEELTMKEIGQILGITESRICQIHTRTVTDLKSRLGAHLTVDRSASSTNRTTPRKGR